MFKRIGTKYFTVIAVLILTSFIFLGGLMVFNVSRYGVSQKEQVLKSTSQTVASYMSDFYNDRGSFQFDIISSTVFVNSINFISESISSKILVANTDGNIIFPFNQQALQDLDLNSTSIPLTIIEKVNKNGYYKDFSRLQGVFKTANLNVAVPIISKSGVIVGSVFVTTTDRNFFNLIFEVLRIFIISSLIVLLVSFLAIYVSSKKLVTPLNQMSFAAKRLAKGDFDVRVPVEGEDEIAQLGAAFNNMAFSLKSLEDMRVSFINNISHDLKTPMTAISGFIDGILDGTIPENDHKHYLNIVSDEIKRLSRLVKTLLEISRLSSGEDVLTIEQFDICETTAQVLLTFEKNIEEKELEISLNCDPENIIAKGDIDAVHRIIYNLIDNAVKFSYEKGKIDININKTDYFATVSIRNEGIGIAEKEIPFIFERFYKSDKSRGLDKSGVGLGLYIAKAFIEKQNGKINVKSVEGEFTEFTIQLPLLLKNN